MPRKIAPAPPIRGGARSSENKAPRLRGCNLGVGVWGQGLWIRDEDLGVGVERFRALGL